MKLIHNIKTLYTMVSTPGNPLGAIDNAVVGWDDNKITFIGQQFPPLKKGDKGGFSLDANGATMLPGLIDCHTHLVFAGSRAEEFAMRSRGATYQEIMQNGGGIRSTMRAVRAASKQELIDLALPRLEAMLKKGVTTIEAKTGYGLSLNDELKTLEVLGALQKLQPIEILCTFLGAHAIPPEYEGQREQYVDHVVNDMLPRIAEQGIATMCDVFVERGAFTVEDGRRILQAAKQVGLLTRVHAEQLSHFGGAKLAAEIGAQGASHLEFVSPEDMKRLADASVVAEILPIAQEYLNLQPVPGRALIGAGVDVAVATDFNPGSAMCNDIHLAARLAVTRCGLTCEEALLGVTANAAKALGRSDIGQIRVGAKADLCLLRGESVWDLLYDWSDNPVIGLFKNGIDTSFLLRNGISGKKKTNNNETTESTAHTEKT